MLDNAIILVYLTGILTLGMWSGRKLKSLKDFSLSHATYGPFVIFATLSASFIGGGFSMGNASKVFLFGIGNIVALWGFSIKELLVAKLIVRNVNRFEGAISAGDIMGRAYGRAAQIITGIFSILLCAGIVGAQVGAMGDVFHIFLEMPELWGILIGCGIVILYSTVGGMRAVVVTDVVQFCILAVGIPLALVMGIAKVGGISGLRDAIPPGHFSIINSARPLVPFISLFLTLMLGEALVPPYVQRLLIGRDLKATARGTLWSGIFSFPFFAITGCIGLVAVAFDCNMDSTLAMPNVIKSALPIGLRGVVVAGVISIVMSSADSFLNGAATGCVNDIIGALSGDISPKKELFLARTTNLLVGVLAVVVAVSIPNILDILIFAYSFWAPTILVPLAAALLGFRTSNTAFATGVTLGVVGTVAWKYGLGDPQGFDGLVFGIFCNLLGFTLGSIVHTKVGAK